jgi:hypothetical protein
MYQQTMMTYLHRQQHVMILGSTEPHDSALFVVFCKVVRAGYETVPA